ncbi:MAG TPA: PAS domain S-box protein [Candidatus Binatia bacterium]|jgi:PAS domain S-box-containing protein|nr:PAS domain S-box protein [Candidatus Binatia bacterium]
MKKSQPLEQLYRLSIDLDTTVDLAHETSIFVRWLTETVQPSLVALFISDEAKQELRLVKAHGFEPPADSRLPWGLDLWRWLKKQGVFVPHAEDPRRYAVPIPIETQLLGTLCLVSSCSDAQLVKERKLVSTAVNYLAPVLRYIWRYRTLERQVAHRTAALAESETHYRSLFENALEGIFRSTPAGRFSEVNPALVHMLGYESAEEVLALKLPDDLYVDSTQRKRLQAQYEPLDVAHSIELLWKRKDGEHIVVNLNGRVICDAQGTLVGYEGTVVDISQRKRAEEALRVSEKRFRALIENSSDAIALLTADGTLLYVSPSSNRMLGRAWEENVGHNIFERIHPDDVEFTRHVLTQLLQRPDTPVTVQLRYQHKDGSWRWVEAVGQNLLAEPSVKAIVVNYRDITERKQVEEEREILYKLAHDLARVSDVSTIADNLLDRTKSLLQADYGWLMLVNATGTELVGVAAYGMAAETFRQERIDLKQEIAPAVVAIQHKQPVVVADVARSPLVSERLRQKYHFVKSAWVTPLMNGEHAVGALLVGYASQREATAKELRLLQLLGDEAALAIERARLTDELRASEERYRSLTVATAQIVWTADPGGQLVGDLSLWGAFTGQREEELKGEGWANALHRDDRQRVLDTWAQAVARRSVYTTVYRLRRYEGEYRYIGVRAVPILEKDGQVREWVGACSDITERKQVEEQLQDYAERLQFLSRRLLEIQESERRTLARELHDELGQVLTGLRLNLEASLHLPPQAARQRVEIALPLANELIGHVRELALDLRPAVLDDLGLAPALEWLCKRYTVRTQVTVTFEQKGLNRRFAPEVETAAYRIVQEALTNVARHAGVSEARVWLGADHDQLTVEIHDQGRGFEPDTVLAAGAGSGLVGMRERAALLGGQLTVEAAPGQGTRIRAHLPLLFE